MPAPRPRCFNVHFVGAKSCRPDTRRAGATQREDSQTATSKACLPPLAFHLSRKLLQQGITFGPPTKRTTGVNVSSLSDIDQAAAPCRGASLRVGQSAIWIIGASDNDAGKSKALQRQWSEADGFSRKAGSFWIGYGNEKSCLNGGVLPICPMSNSKAGETMRDDNCR
jgi:hypothetical protein